MKGFTVLVCGVLLSACTTVSVTNAGFTGHVDSKPDDCEVRFYRLVAPAGSVEEIGSALLEGSVFVTPADAERELRRRACHAGADAVIITKEDYAVPFFGSVVKGVFVRVRAPAPPA